MIIKEYGKFNLYCDFCDTLIGTYDSFGDALLGLKENKVKIRYENGEYMHICNSCFYE